MTNAIQRLDYEPDHASPPGELIQEHLETLGISARELARRCGRSGKLMAEIAAGKAPIEPETALQLERVLNIPASVWIRMEAAYQLHQAREAETATLAASYPWASKFPLRQLCERSFLARPADKSAQVRELLRFFGVGNVKACEERLEDLLAVDFRTSTSFKNDTLALAAWLRIGELRAAAIETADYDREKFVHALREIRELSLIPIDVALPKLTEKCAAAGVAFVLEKGLPKIRASGISRWLTPRRALIQQSLRYKSDDHFWFTFFHEAAHILLHSRKEIFIDMAKGPGSADPKQEAEANVWAADFLVPASAMRTFVLTFAGGEDEVRKFAAKQKISPGIIVGQLQHNGVIGFAALNGLKARYEWSDE
jgi:addiction module HigA family antidote